MEQGMKVRECSGRCLAWLFLAVGTLALVPSSALSQRVLVEWNFPTNSADAVADGGIAANTNRTLSAAGGVGVVSFPALSPSTAPGASTFCAGASGWNGADATNFWMVGFSSSNFASLTLSSRQRSSSAGPANFAIQYRIGEGDWESIPGGAITCANNFNAGVVTNLPLPVACNDQSLVALRWIMTNTVSVTNGTVSPTGVSNIDDIIVRGTRISVPAPQTLPASGVSASQFTANWLPVDDATGYQLDVATNAAFAVEFPVNLLRNHGFETGDSSGWTVEPGYSVQGEFPQYGNYAVKGVATTTRSISQTIPIPAADGSTIYEISYWYRVTAGDGTDVRIWSSWNTGKGTGDNLQPTTYNVSTSVWSRMVYTNMPANNTTNFRFEVRVYSNATVYLDSFSFRTHGPYTPSDFVPGYESRAVAAPGHLVGGLTKGTYYYRVRAVDGSVVSGNSAVIRVRASDVEPGLLLFVH